MINPKLGRTKSHRELMLANLAKSVIKAEKVKTTLPRARAARRVVERWITLAKKANLAEDSLAYRKRLYRFIQDRELVDKLIDDLAIRAKSREGGYTRLLKVGSRVGDASPVVVLAIVDKAPVKVKSKSKGAK
ncbi:50S ribosomal protein L17 [Candidatus Berkelbacteria bacterium]|nr:50S ribosomal protein L17 [Candidatus Berkelbacteria bacterium]